MSDLKALASNVKFWIVFVTAVVGVLVALGATVDRPAWISEVQDVAEQSAKNSEAILQEVRSITELVAGNSKKVLEIEIDAVQRRVWDQEDRQKASPTTDGAQRLRELRLQLKRLQEKLRTKG